MYDENQMRKRNALIVVMGVNVALVILIFILAAVSGSMALQAAGWMSVENLFLTFGIFAGVLISGREKEVFSRRVTLIENLLALSISVFIFYIATRMFIKVVSGPKMMLKNIPITIAGVFIGMGMCYFMARYKIYIGKRYSSPSIEAAGYHCKSHVFMWLAVAAGLVGYMIGLTTLNRLAAVFVLIYVISVGWGIFTRAYKALTSGLPMEHICHWQRNYKQRLSLAGLIFLIYLCSGFYIVHWHEEGIVKRFGRKIRDKISPGLHYHLPLPFESVIKVKVSEVKKLECERLLLLTGDENLVEAKIGVQYAIKDASDYSFNIAQSERLIRNNTETVLRHIISRNNIDYLLTTGKSGVEEDTGQRLQGLLDKDQSGIQVLSVQVLTLNPPQEISDAFRDVANAKEDMFTFINQAEAYYNQVVPEAKGKALAEINRARGYKIKKINNSRGEADNYLKQLEEYQKARAVTDLRFYLETMERILPGREKVLVSPDIKKETTDLWFFDKSLKGKRFGLE